MDLATFQAAVPKPIRKWVTQEFVDSVDLIEKDPYVAEHIKENLLSYASVLNTPKVELKDYLNYVRYITYKLRGDTAIQCYAKTFPDRYANVIARGDTSIQIGKLASSVEQSQIFKKLMEQAILPSWILNYATYQKAINVQAELMMTAKSEKVRSDAANSIMMHLARPKEIAPLVSIDISGSSELDTLKSALVDLAKNQKCRIVNGETTKVIAGEVLVSSET